MTDEEIIRRVEARVDGIFDQLIKAMEQASRDIVTVTDQTLQQHIATYERMFERVASRITNEPPPTWH
jgi:hypothetical protein